MKRSSYEMPALAFLYPVATTLRPHRRKGRKGRESSLLLSDAHRRHHSDEHSERQFNGRVLL